MSHKKQRKDKLVVKCAYCGRDDVPVVRHSREPGWDQFFMRPHRKMDGRPCLHGSIPHKDRIQGLNPEEK